MPSKEQSFLNSIEKEVKSRNIAIDTIIDVGAFDLEESIELHKIFKPSAHIAFEADPRMEEICITKTCSGERLKIAFYSCGISNFNGKGIFKISELRQSSVYNPINEKVEKEVEISFIRLDSFVNVPDLLFMDIQGSEKNAIEGLGQKLQQVKVIATELILQPMYENAPLFDEVDEILKEHFELVFGNPFEGMFDNFIYIRKDLA